MQSSITTRNHNLGANPNWVIWGSERTIYSLPYASNPRYNVMERIMGRHRRSMMHKIVPIITTINKIN